MVCNNPNHLIGGVTEEINVVLHLSEKEYDKLNEFLLEHMNVTVAICAFTHSDVCSRHHKYKIWENFGNGVEITSYKYMGSITSTK